MTITTTSGIRHRERKGMGFGWEEAGGWDKIRAGIFCGSGEPSHHLRNTLSCEGSPGLDLPSCPFLITWIFHHDLSLILKLQCQKEILKNYFWIFIFFLCLDGRKHNESTRHRYIIQQSNGYFIMVCARAYEPQWKGVNVDQLTLCFLSILCHHLRLLPFHRTKQ